MLRLLVIVPVLAAVAPASAETVEAAFAVNPPLRWEDGVALAASGYVGFGKHHAIRANVARFANNHDIGAAVAHVLFSGDGDDASRSGYTFDAGVGYMYFPRKLWSGPTLEVGALVRHANTRDVDDFAPIGIIETHTNTLAARALVGWSWLLGEHLFVSVAVGLSTGYERGRETTSMRVFDPVYETHQVGRSATSAEGFLRIGGAFTP